ncbi:nucleotidyltransferase family protein [Desulfococcaceae bacterium HSG7]|nr:nucleotidyltransferase family protein [Desulfococcaceae bacterium HSG7]
MCNVVASDLKNIVVVILAGGLGTRLRSKVKDRPKIIAEVMGRPFITFLLDQVAKAGAHNVVLSTGYMAEKVQSTLGNEYNGMQLHYSTERAPLGTGGGLRLSLPFLKSDTILVMNGDSYIDADLSDFSKWYAQKQSSAAVILKKVPDTKAYGRVALDDERRVKAFIEKGEKPGSGWVNAGVYMLKKDLVEYIPLDEKYSLERQFFPTLINKGFYAYCCDGKFLDIGTPTNYLAATLFFLSLLQKTAKNITNNKNDETNDELSK